MALLDPDVALRPDAAALRMGSLQPTHGAAHVATALSGGAGSARVALIDGVAGLAWNPTGRVRGLVAFRIVGGRIVDIDVTGDPERIRSLDVVLVDE